jgi:hypothetical protein
MPTPFKLYAFKIVRGSNGELTLKAKVLFNNDVKKAALVIDSNDLDRFVILSVIPKIKSLRTCQTISLDRKQINPNFYEIWTYSLASKLMGKTLKPTTPF